MNNTLPIPDWRPRQIVLGTLYVVLVIAAFLLLIRFRDVVFILFVAIVISTAISPGVEWLSRRGVPRPVGVILIYLALAALIIGSMMLVAPLVIRQSVSISTVLPDYYTQIKGWFVNSDSFVLRRLGYELPAQLTIGAPSESGPAADPEAVLGRQVESALTAASLAARTIFTGIAVFLLAFYWTLDGDRTVRALLLLIPQRMREGGREIIAAIQEKVGAFVVGQLFLSLVIGVMSLISYVLIGVPNAFLLAIFAGIMEAVPVFGPTLGAVPPVLLVLATGQPSKILWILGSTIVIQFLENNLLVPRVGKRVGVNPMVTLLALAAFSSLFGIAGAILAIPLAAVIQLILDRIVLNRPKDLPTEIGGRDAVSALRVDIEELATDIRKHVREKDRMNIEESDDLEDAIEHLANDLDQLLVNSTPSPEEQRMRVS